jgi:hypothetical protein
MLEPLCARIYACVVVILCRSCHRFFADAWMLFPREDEYIEWFTKVRVVACMVL